MSAPNVFFKVEILTEQPLFQRPASSCTAAKHVRMKIDLDLCSILSVHALLAGAETLHAWNLRAALVN